MENSTPETQGRLSVHFLTKAIIFGVLIFAGVAGGVYVGTAISNRPAPFETTPELMSNSSYLSINDAFPDYELIAFDSKDKFRVSDLSKQGPLLLVFLSTSCDACHHLAEAMGAKLIKELNKEIQVALVFDSADLQISGPLPNSVVIPNARVFLTDRGNQASKDGIHVMPSMFGIDRANKIKIAITGYNMRINAEFINKYLT